jgi:Ras-related protein Rab-1A
MEVIDYLFKVLIVGNSGVGKSALLQKYTEGTFNEHYLATIGVDFKIKTLDIDDKKVKLQIWDTAGQERFRSITTSYYRGAHGIFIVYDVTNRKSFNEVRNWVREAHLFHIPSSNILLIGNKIDLAVKREVHFNEGQELAQEIGCSFLETSSILNVSNNVDTMFETMARTLKSQCLLMKSTDALHGGRTKVINTQKVSDTSSNCKC